MAEGEVGGGKEEDEWMGRTKGYSVLVREENSVFSRGPRDESKSSIFRGRVAWTRTYSFIMSPCRLLLPEAASEAMSTALGKICVQNFGQVREQNTEVRLAMGEARGSIWRMAAAYAKGGW